MKYKIPVTWSVTAEIEVEAPDVLMATEIADKSDLEAFSNVNYVDGSLEVNNEVLREINNLSPEDKALL